MANIILIPVKNEIILKLNPGLAAYCKESQTCETGAGEKESDLFERWHLEKMSGPLSSKTHLNISGQASHYCRELVGIVCGGGELPGSSAEVQVLVRVGRGNRGWWLKGE